ncbi:MAG: hypothetical protein IT433_06310 [Phycisphaerales bacterium]|nr:hypothetical protein [Phycisphaerales bacterium]
MRSWQGVNSGRTFTGSRWAVVRALCWLLLLVLGVGHLWAQTTTTTPPPAFRAARTVVVIPLRGEIDDRGVMATSLRRRLALAERAGADAIVIEIDSPGGSVDAVLQMCRAIKGSRVRNTVAWINSDAYSGGAIVALACREIVINDPVSFGDAKPISGGPLGILPQGIPDDLLKKILPPLVAEVTESVRRHNEFAGSYDWDEYLAKAMIVDDMRLWAVRNKSTGERVCIDPHEFRLLFGEGADPGGATRLASLSSAGPSAPADPPPAEGIASGSSKLAAAADAVVARLSGGSVSTRRPKFSASDRDSWELEEKVLDGSGPALLKADDMVYFGFAANTTTDASGRTVADPVRTDDDLVAFFQAKRLVRYEASWSEGLVLVMTHIATRFVLVVIFLIAMFLEITHPGAALPGIIAVAALAGLVAPPMLIGMASWWAVVAIICGIGMLLLEVFVVPGFGAPGIFGLILLFLGLVGVFAPSGNGLVPSSPEGRTDLLYYGATVLLAMVTAAAGIALVARNLRAIPGLSRLVLRDAPGDDDGPGTLDALAEAAPDAPAIGEVGVAITVMRPAGRVEIRGAIVDAVAEFGMIEAGTSVRITSVDGMRVGVEPERGTTA